MNALQSDLTYALRSLARSRGFALATILSIALGVGANALVFTWMDSLVLNPYPRVRSPERLVALNADLPDGFPPISYPMLRDLRDAVATVPSISGYANARFSLRRATDAPDATSEPVWGQFVTGDFFQVLGVAPEAGRSLTMDDERQALPAAVISDSFWRRHFDASASAVGAQLYLNGAAVTVVGIAPPSFGGILSGLGFDVWVPVTLQPVLQPGATLSDRQARWLQAVGRLRDGATLDQAKLEVSTTSRTVSSKVGEQPVLGVRALRLREQFLGSLLFPLFSALLAITGLLLLIACANVAGLLLSRATARQGEIGVRVAMGASRPRIMRQLLTESVVISALGGGLGVVLASLMEQVFLWFIPSVPFPISISIGMSGRVVAFAILVTALAAAVFGLTPAYRASRIDVAALLRDAVRSSLGSKSHLRSMLVVGQVAFSLVALVCAGLFLRSLIAARTFDLGFGNPDAIVVVNTDLKVGGIPDSSGAAVSRALLRAVREIPGVEGVALSTMVPLGFGGHSTAVTKVDGYTPARDESMEIERVLVSDGYFETMQLPIVQGRGIDANDIERGLRVVVVNEALAQRYWPNVDAIGRRLDQGDGWATVVGVVRNSKMSDLVETPYPVAYSSIVQSYRPVFSLHVRTSTPAVDVLPQLRRAFVATQASLPFLDPRTLREHMAAATFVQRIGAAMLGAFGSLALLLTAVGLYGVVSYAVSLRTREIGLRMAMGLSPAGAALWVVRYGVRLALIGIALGTVAAFGIAQLLASQLVGIKPGDPVTFAGIGVLLMIVATLAGYLPARRAARLDPSAALRF